MANNEFKALGKGLSSLIPNKISRTADGVQDAENKLIEISIDKVIPNAHQPRKNFRDDEILELSESIKIHGVLQPILLNKTEDGNYQIIAGERRWRAAKLASLKTIPAIIKGFTEKENIEISLIENIQREDLSPLEEASIYEKLIGEYNYTQEKLAEKIGKSRSYIANLVRLLKLPEKFKKLLAEDKLSAGHARLLLNCKSPDDLVQIIQENNLSVREAESIVNNSKPLKSLDFYKGLKDPDLVRLEKKIEHKLKLKTRITIGQKDGNITINFKTMDEFDYLIAVLCEDVKLKI
jgi:ParB family chromosome partitioning protein